jgi:hypothetical protein
LVRQRHYERMARLKALKAVAAGNAAADDTGWKPPRITVPVGADDRDLGNMEPLACPGG